MRRLVIVLGLLAVAAPAPAQTLYVTEPFSGLTAGNNLAGQGSGGGWADPTWGGTGATVQSTGLSYGGLLTSGGAAATSVTTINSRTAGAASGGATNYWFSFLINTTGVAAGDYAGISVGNVFVGKPSGTTNTWGIDQVGGANLAPSAVTITSGATTLLVANVDTVANTVRLYVNPASLGGAAPGTADATETGFAPTALDNSTVRLFNGSTLGGIPITVLDEFRVGDSFAAVTPVPEPMTLLTVGAAGLGLVGFARRRLC